MEPAPEFSWRDGERWIVFGEATLERAAELLEQYAWSGFALVSTERALEAAPAALKEAAASVHHVPSGGVPEATESLLGEVESDDVVALGGGRVIDTAKALAAIRGGRAAAIPTTLSGAEMTWVHRLPPAHEDAGRVRPALVLADPDPMTTMPDPGLRASAMNALAHGAEALYTPFANPVSTMAALSGVELIANALDQEREGRDRAGLALGSILCAYGLDSSGFALHHVLCQTLVRVCGIPHAETNATVLPHTMAAMRERAPAAMEALAGALGTSAEELPTRIAELAGEPARLGELGADRALLDEVVSEAAARAELQLTPDPPTETELARILQAAW
jgi:alcohol dehydrogenase class IV